MPNPLALVWNLIATDGAVGPFQLTAAAANETADATERAAVSTDAASASMTRAGKSAEASSGLMADLTKHLGAIIAVGAAIDIGKRAVDDAVQFQSQMTLIRTQANDTTDNLKTMSSAVLALAGTVAQSPEALANSLYHVTSVGLRAADAMNVVKLAAEGAKVGHADLEQTTNALTAAFASGIPGVQNMSQAMGALNATVGAGDMQMSDLNDAMSTGVLVTVKQYGLTMNDVGAALADFGDNNIRGADAATKLRMAVQGFASPMKAGAASFAALGMSTTQLATDMQTGGLNKALTDLHDHLVAAGDTGAKAGQILTDMFGKKAGAGVLVLEGTYDRFEQKVGQVAAGANDFQAQWKTTTDTVSFQFDSLKDRVKALGIELATNLLPGVDRVAGDIGGALSSAITNATRFFDTHKSVVNAIVTLLKDGLVGALTIVGGLLLSFAADALLAAAPFVLMSLAIGAVVLGLIDLYKHSATFRSIVTGAVKEVKKAFDDLKKDVDSFALGFEHPEIAGAVGKWQNDFIKFGAAVGKLFDEVKSDVKNFILGLENPDMGSAVGQWQNGFIKFGGQVRKVFDKIKSDIDSFLLGFEHPEITKAVGGWQNEIISFGAGTRRVFDEIKGAIVKTFDALKPVVSDVVDFIKEHWNVIKYIVLAIGPPIVGIAFLIIKYWKQIEGAFKDVKAVVKDVVGAITGFLEAHRKEEEKIWGNLKAIWADIEGIIQDLVPIFKFVFEVIAGIVLIAVNQIISLWDRFGKQLLTHLQTELNATLQVLRGVFEVIKGVFDVFAGIFTGKWSKVWTGIKEIFGGVWNIIAGVFKIAINTISTILGGAVAVFSLIGSDIMNGLLDGVKYVWNTISGWVNSAMNGLISLVKSIFGIHSPSTVMATLGMDIITGLWNGMKSIWTTLIGWVGGLGKLVLDGIGDFSKTLYDAGTHLLSGMLSGMKDGLGDVLTWVKNHLGSGILSGVKSVFDIGSPSKLMAREVGSPISEGIAKGITDNEAFITKAVKQVGNNLAKTKLPIPGSSGSPYSSNGANGLAPVINNYITQQPGQDSASLAAVVSRTTARSIRVH